VGWGLQRQLAPGTRSALEHGGAAPVIVDRDADLPALIDPLTKGGYYHAGQVCVSTQRIFVHQAVYDDFVARFAARVGRLTVGDPTREATEVGPMIAPSALERVAAWVDEAIAGGAGVAAGGQRLSETLYAPTVLLDPPEQARVSREEVFGPVTCVYRYTALDDAIARANRLVYAFQAAIFTRDLAAALHAAERLWASGVMVNDHTAFRTDWMPFAGLGRSGYGVGGVPAAMAAMTQEKMVVFRLP
jgi:acyl-CoA reductase-like NAD-dependent aldehyde dehydrogenase